MPSVYDPIRRMTKKDRKDIYDYAMKRSRDIQCGRDEDSLYPLNLETKNEEETMEEFHTTETRKTKARCVCCQGIIVERITHDEEQAIFEVESDPLNQTSAWIPVDKVDGYHCSACGLEYYKLPQGQK